MSALHLSWARLDKVSQAGQSQGICHDGENNFYLAHLAPNCQEISLRLSGTLPVLHLLELDLWRIEEVPDRSQGTQDTWRDIVILEEHRNYQNNPSSTQFFIQILQFHLTPQTFPMCSVRVSQMWTRWQTLPHCYGCPASGCGGSIPSSDQWTPWDSEMWKVTPWFWQYWHWARISIPSLTRPGHMSHITRELISTDWSPFIHLCPGLALSSPWSHGVLV